MRTMIRLQLCILSLLLAATAHSEGTTPSFNEQRNLYFGDTHVHTALSLDSYFFGNRVGLDGAYRFAKGEPIELATGQTTQLSRPLDFVVMTDHAESFGLFETCARDTLSETQSQFCAQSETLSTKMFKRLRQAVIQRPVARIPELCGGDKLSTCLADADTTWNKVRAAADAHNEPGTFTAFLGYEYSPALPGKGKVHRNVIFRNSTTPNRAISAYDAATVLDLWRGLETECTGECEFLTIPHNMNKTWGIAYSGRSIDGDPYEDHDWALRGRNEPLAEIFQIKGSSECGYDLGASDEECNFELISPLCKGEQVSGCSGRYSFAREGLKEGLKLQQRLSYNPLQFGFIGSTDSHNSIAGATEEDNFRGSKSSSISAKKRLRRTRKGSSAVPTNPGGLAAVWAKENTRDAIFEAMQRRETYATSGTRIKLRFFASWGFEQGLLDDSSFLSKAYRDGVPMGSVLPKPEAKSTPEFLVWALKDSDGADLQRIQMIKAWVDKGEGKEQVFDIACSDGLFPDPASGRCPDNGAKVDITTCEVSADKGDQEIKFTWRDPDFDANHSAIYYVRVLENPSCRWSTYDALALGMEIPANVPATIQERAWSSPIWYTP
ncbi:MAG: DUF3604 domain-containing protein [Pseudomonadales bacterium]